MKAAQIILVMSLLALLADGQDGSVNKKRPLLLHSVLLRGGYGFIDNSGKLAIRASDRVHNVREFSEGLAVIAVKPSRGQITDGASKWGYLDLAGNIVIQPEYERATDFSEGLAAVQLAGKWGYIDKFGKHVIDFDYYSAAEAFEM